jgi:taurine--2-oxoglutarate transaminase
MTDWSAVENWDRNYYLHNTAGDGDYAFVAVDRMDGNWLTLANGHRLLDFQSQLISDSMGHRHPGAFDELRRAMERYGHVFFGMANEYRARAAKLIVADILGGDSGWAGRVRVLTSGTEAVEICITMARLYTGRRVVLTQAHSFHGLTVGPSFLRGYRNNITPHDAPNRIVDVPGFPSGGFIPIPPPEHDDFAATGPLPSLVATEQLIRAIGPENIAAVITEPMFGAAGLYPHRDYGRNLAALAKKYGFLWIDDEVLCGFGRLGTWFGYQRDPDIAPDLMAIGKGVNGSALPAGAVVASKPIADFFERSRWWSGSTWDGHPLVCASIVGNLEYMLEHDMLAQVNERGDYLRRKLEWLKSRHHCVGRISGAGLYYAVDLVNARGEPIVAEDRYTGFVGDLTRNPNAIVARECAKRGVFLGGFVPNTVKVGPPFTITPAEIDLGIDAFDAALTEVERSLC